MSACAVARAALARHVASLGDASLTAKLGAAIKRSYLGTVTSAVKHVGSLVLKTPMGIVNNAGEASADYLLSLVNPLRPRTASFVSTPRGLANIAKGGWEGTRDFASAMKSGVDPERVGDAFNLKQITYNTPILESARRYLDTFVSARNKPFWEGSWQASLYGQAKTMAINEGLTGARATARINQLLAAPSHEMSMNALAHAREFTLSAETPVEKAIGGMRESLNQMAKGPKAPSAFDRARAQAASEGLTGDRMIERASKLMALKPEEFKAAVGGSGLPSKAQRLAAGGNKALAQLGMLGLDITAPFPRVMSNIGGQLLDYSPVGPLKAAVQAAGQQAGERMPVLMKGITKSGIGNAIGFATGYYLASKGLMTGPHPANPALTGGGPYMTRVGKTWHDLRVFAPVGAMPVLGAAFYEASKNHPGEILGNLGRATGEQLKSITEESFLNAMAQVGNLASSLKDAGSAVSRLVPIPPLLGQIARGTDAQTRDVSAPTLSGQVTNQLKARIPGLRETLPVKPNAFGQVPKSEGLASALLDPTRPAADRTTAVTQELDRLGISLKNPQGKMTRGPVSIQLTPGQKLAGVESMGPDLERRLTALMASPSYATASDQLKAREVKRLVSLTHRVGMAPQFKQAYDQGQAVRAR